MTAALQADTLRKEARSFATGTAEWAWRMRAAWTLYQIAHGVPVDEQTDEPPRSFTHPQEGVAA